MSASEETAPLLKNCDDLQNKLLNREDTDSEATNSDEYGNGKKIWWPPFVLLCVFSTSSALLTNSMVAELPVVVQVFPEREAAATYAVVLMQVSHQNQY